MKKFIATSPFQEKLSKYKYASDNPKLFYDCETSYPIIPVIANSAEEGEKVKILSIVADFDAAKRNEDGFKQELENLSKAKNFSYEIQELLIPFEESTDKNIELFGNLIESISDGDELNADITYGSKLMSVVTMMSLNYGYKLRKDVSIGHLVYGEVKWKEGIARIHDASALFFMNTTVFNLAQSHIEDPVKVIRYMLET